MAKEKKLERDRVLGTIKKRLSSGMYETDKGEKVPPFPGVAIGDKVVIKGGKFAIGDGKKKKESIEPVDPKDAEIAKLRAEKEQLEKIVGEHGSKIAALEKNLEGGKKSDDNGGIKPPKVEE